MMLKPRHQKASERAESSSPSEIVSAQLRHLGMQMGAPLSGWLLKRKSSSKCRIFSEYNRRYFTLHFGAQLFFYADSESQRKAKVSEPVPFSEIKSVEPWGFAGQTRLHSKNMVTKHGGQCGFIVETSSKTMELLCTKQEDAVNWITAIQEAMSQASLAKDQHRCTDAKLRWTGYQEDDCATMSTTACSSPEPSVEDLSSLHSSGLECYHPCDVDEGKFQKPPSSAPGLPKVMPKNLDGPTSKTENLSEGGRKLGPRAFSLQGQLRALDSPDSEAGLKLQRSASTRSASTCSSSSSLPGSFSSSSLPRPRPANLNMNVIKGHQAKKAIKPKSRNYYSGSDTD